MQADEILTYNVRNARGQLVPVSSFATARWSVGPSQIVGFNYYPSVRISGSAKPGYTSGDAIGEMERLAAQLPRGFGYDWTGQSLQEKLSGSQAPFLLMLSALHGFLVRWVRDFASERNRHSARFYRIINEVPTVLMIGIVILAVVKPF